MVFPVVGEGSILIAASGTFSFSGTIRAQGGGSDDDYRAAGGGSGGAVRLLATRLIGAGSIDVTGGPCSTYYNGYRQSRAGAGRVRLDAMDNQYAGTVQGDFTFGYQPIIIPPPVESVSLAIDTVAGVDVSSSPVASPVDPNVVVPANVEGPVEVVVRCANIPLSTRSSSRQNLGMDPP